MITQPDFLTEIRTSLAALAAVKTTTLSPELIRYIENVVWGYAAGVRYQIFERQAMLQRLLPPGYFFILRKFTREIGTLFCLPKKVSLGENQVFDAVYESILSIHPSEHGEGYAQKLIATSGTSLITRGFHYAYVEDQNVPSTAVFAKQDYRPIGQFHAMTINRLRPRRSPRVCRLILRERIELLNQMKVLYRGHALMDLDVSLRPDQYWVIRQNDKIVAGVQIAEERWRINSMPGVAGWLAVKLLPRLPGLNRILNPENIPVLKIGNLYIAPGYEKVFMELIEHLLHAHQRKLALAYLDKRSPVTQRLTSNLDFGFLNPLFETPVTIWARFKGFSESEITGLKMKNFVVSPLDIS